MLKSTVHGPYQSVSRKVAGNESQDDRFRQEMSALKKVDSKDERIVNESMVIVVNKRDSKNSDEGKSRQRSSTGLR